MNSTIQRAVGLVEENEAILKKVAMAKKPVRKKTMREEMRRDCRKVSERTTTEEDEGLTQSEMGVPSSANWKPTKPLSSRHQ